MPSHPRRRVGRLPAALVLAVAVGCGAPTEKVTPGRFPGVAVQAQAMSTSPAFADQAGDGLLLSNGAPARIRLDGSLGPLESHPGNVQPPGAAQALFPLSTHAALLAASNGLYLVQSGWMLEAPWGPQLDPTGVRGTTDAGDGSAWIAHDTGLYRLKAGALSELKVGGRSVTGLTAVVASRAEDGTPAVWFAHAGGLSAVVTSDTGLKVRSASLPGASSLKFRTLAAVGDSDTAPGEVWALTDTGEVYRDAESGWRRLELPAKATSLAAAGRTAWVTVEGKGVTGAPLYRYDADARTWETVDGLPAPSSSLLAADASGAAWVTLTDDAGAKATYLVAKGRTPRVRGLDQNMQLPEGELVVQAAFPPGPAPKEVHFLLDGATDVPATGPLYSLGGDTDDGKPRSYSFVGLSQGVHTLSLKATYADDATAERVVPYAFLPSSQEVLGWDKDIRPIHEARCAKCHVSGPGIPLDSYELWKANAADIVTYVREKRMPADGPLEPDLILKIQRWVQGGQLP